MSKITERKDEEASDDDGSKKNGAGQQQPKFKDMFPNIQEDEFESSDDNDEKKKNEKLERLGKVAAPHQKQ
jgi:hypothetical protein